jgi:O-antigen ligase
MGTITSLGADPTGSAAERLTDLMAAGRLVQASPLTGVGVGMNALAMNAERGTTWRMVHNVYLQIAVELGIPGLIVFLVLLVRTIRKAGTARLTAARTGNGRTAFRLAEALQISLIAFAVAALFHPIGYNFYFYYIAGMSLGIGTAIRANATRGEATVA